MNTVTISKKEYESLMVYKLKYDYLQLILSADLFASPPTKKTELVVDVFAKTGKYNDAFIDSLQKGLKRSTFFNKNENN